MSLLRDDARRALAGRRSRSSATPARVSVPLGSSVAAVALAVLVADMVGLSLPVVVLVGVVVTLIAAVLVRRTLSSLVAGAGLLLVQPYVPGEQVRVHVPALGGVVDAEVVRVGPANTTLMTSDGLVLVPNAHMLRPDV